MNDEERLLERCLREVDVERTSVEEISARHLARHPALAARLRLIAATREVAPPAAETHAAYLRVRDLLMHEVTAESAQRTNFDWQSVRPGQRLAVSQPRVPAWLVRAAAIAAVLFGLAIGTGVTTAAASAAPNSPLYAIKRGEEWVALSTAWSDERKADVLLTIAAHRLDEVHMAAGYDDRQAVRLTVELDATVRDAIALLAHMTDAHENTDSFAAGIAHTLAAEQGVLQAAKEHGQSELAQALQAAADAQQQSLADHRLVLPTPGAGHDKKPPTGGPATPSPAGDKPRATPSPSGSGSGDGNGNGGAHPTPTPRR